MSGKNPLGSGREPQTYEGTNAIFPLNGFTVVRSSRDPTNPANASDKKYPAPSLWLNKTTGALWYNSKQSTNWVELSAGAGAVDTLTGDSGGAISPSGANITLAGTANQISTTGSGSTITMSLVGPYTPATYTAHGVLLGEGTSSIAATTAGTNGQVLLGSTGADPAFGTITSSTGVAFTTGAASLAVNLKQGGYNINAASTGGTIAVQNSYTVTQAAQTSFALPTTAAVGDMFLIASATGNTSGWIITQAASQEIWANTSHTTNGVGGTLAGAIHTSVVLMCTVANLEFTIVGGTGLTGLTFT